MDKEFLNKVVGQIVYETRINYRIDILSFPFRNVYKEWVPFDFIHRLLQSVMVSFKNHCRDVYSLNEEESDYVWGEYVMRIRHLTIHSDKRSFKRKNNG
jgi:hypothetical protein